MKTNKRKRNYLKHPFRRMTALFLAAAMLLGLLPVQGQSLFGGQTVKAAGITLSNPKKALSNPKKVLSNPKTEEGVTTWDCVYFGNYAQSDTTGVTKEPIKWRVLSVDEEENAAVLLADQNLEIKKYNETFTDVTWETSTLRTWLNSTSDDTSFLNTAFTAEEQAAIRDTEVVNNKNPQHGTAGGDNTIDKVYLLSIEESMNTAYGFTGTTSDTDTRKVKDTAYVGSKNFGSGSYGLWWLRSPGSFSKSAAIVGAAGETSQDGCFIYDANPAVRPALQIDLQSLSVWDYAGTVDSDKNVTSSDMATTWDCVYFGNYAQSDTTGVTKEPIKWRVLSVDEEENTAVLLADQNLEIKKYNETYTKVTWETSTLRTWLNSTSDDTSFLNTAFTAEEQAAIRDTEVVNNANPQYGTDGGADTIDKIYLLSIEEAMNTAYGFTGTTSDTDTRKVEDTAYVGSKNSGKGSYGGLWWLRSPGYFSLNAAYVGASGGVSQIGNTVDIENPAVRPALQINLHSLSVWDYAGTVDLDGNVTSSDTVTTWDCVYFGNYAQSDTIGATKEPIKWRVLSVDEEENTAVLLADKNLEIKEYNETQINVTWETCTLRTWLNSTSDDTSFLNTAFTAEEQAAIRETEVVNNNPQNITPGGDNTTDKVYLLSIEESMNTAYGFTSTAGNTNTREVEDTTYVKSKNYGYGSSGLWWLRSPGNYHNDAAYVGASGGVAQKGSSVCDTRPAVRPALHINLQSLSQWTYAGTVDSEGNVTEPSITVGIQTKTVTYGTAGSTTYEVEGKNFVNPVFEPEVVWKDTTPEGITPVFNEGNTQLTLTASATSNAGTYPFKVTSGETESAEATLTIGKADASAITTAVENVSMTAYEAREHTTKEAVVALANLPSEVEVSLSGGGTVTRPITWATSTTYDAKGEAYAVTGTLTGNDNINVGSVTKPVTVTVTPINAPKPTFADISVFKDENKSAATATGLGSEVLPGSGTVTIDVGGGETETVGYTIEWNDMQTLDMTEADNNTAFTGNVSYPYAPSWLTLPTDATATRKVTVKEKTPVSVTVTAPASITYGEEELGNPSADTGDTVDDAAFTYQYSGTLFDGSGTQYSSTNKPTGPGSYTVAAILVSATHMGTSETGSFTISKKDLGWATDGIANNKTYDGTTTATAATQPKLGGVIYGDTVEALAGDLAFASINVDEGIAVTASGYGITGTHAWKYNAPSSQPAFGSGTITPRNITFTVEPIDSLDYTGQGLTPPVVVKDGTTTLTLDADYEVSYLGNTNAGTASVTVDGKRNYKGSTGNENFTINKIAYTGVKTANKEVVANTATTDVTVTLPGVPDGAGYGTPAVTTENGLVTGTPSILGTTLTFNTATRADGVTDTITIPVTGAINYNNYDITVTVTAKTVEATLSGRVVGYKDITLTGTQEVTVTLDGDTFVEALSGNWITNLPTGLTQSVTKVDDNTAKITVKGSPAQTSNAQIAVTIPSGALVTNSSASILAVVGDAAKYDIAEATYTLAFDGGPGSFTALTYGYATGSSVTYTIKNTGNQTVNGIAAAISAGDDYFKAGTPSTTTLAPGEAATVTVTSKTGLDASGTAYAGTLEITWTDGEGQTGIGQGLSQKVDKVDQAALSITGLDNSYEIGTGPVTLGTDGGSGTGAVTYGTSDTAIASVSGSLLTIHKKADFTVTAAKAGDTNYNGASSAAFAVTVTDTTAPTGEINVKNSSWKQFLNTVTFGLFFKDTVDVTITAEDNSGEEVAVEYYLSATGLTEEEAREVASWTTGESFHINASSKYIIYARLTDTSGNNATINSDGIVVYSDSVAGTVEIEHIKFTGDKGAAVTLNGNTINRITNGPATLEEGEDYTANGGQITFRAGYLDSLAAGAHTLTVHYNPMNLAYEDGADNDIPATTGIALTVHKATVSEITTAVSDVNMTAYEAKDATTEEAVVALAGLPSTVEVSLTDGGIATLGIEWETSMAYDAKGKDYAVTGTLTGNDDINVGSVTKQATVTVTQINAPKPTFADIYVLMDTTKPAAAAADLGPDVLPDSGTVTILIVSGITETVGYTIDWSGTEKLNMTAKDNNMTFTGEASYLEAPKWLTLPDTMVTRKVIVTDKTPTTVTATAPGDITYGGDLGSPSAGTGGTVDGAEFTYHYSGTLSDGSTPYSSDDKPGDPGSYEVTATLVSDTHIGTSDPASFTIQKKGLDWATDGVAGSKAYDGTKDAAADTQPTLGGIINDDIVEVQIGTASFASADAGSGITVTASGYGIAGTHAWKYNAPSGQPAFANGTILPKKMTFTAEPIDSLDYTGQALAPPVVVKDGEAVLTLERDYTVSYSDNTNAGTATVTITGKGNYEGSTGGKGFTINKAAYNGEKAAAKNVLSDKAAAGVTVTLPGLPEGAGYGTAAVTTTNGLVTGTPSVNGITLTFDVGPKEAGTTDTITIPVTGATNYTDYDVMVTITAVEKITVTISGVTVEEKTYDGNAVTTSGTPAANDGTSVVDISDYDYKWQDAGGGILAGAPEGAGSYKLIVSVPESNPDYTGSQEEISFTVSKATVTITADDKTATAGDPEPAYTCTVDGLASGESLKKGPILSCTPDMNKAGAYTITPSAAEVPDSRNYENDIIYGNGKLTVQAAQVTNASVSFHANGGSGSMAPVSVRKGSYTLPSCTYSRSNFSFAGWKVNNTGTTYAAGDSITVSGNMTLFAQWTSNGPAFTAVTNITGVPTTATVGTALTLKGNAQPSNATNRTVQWSVKSKGTTGARISGGKLQTSGSGTAVITATIKNGRTSTANYTKDFPIKVSYPVRKGSTYTFSGYQYKVTSITNSKKEVTFAGLTAAKKKTATTLSIGNTVKINGITMKITAIGKNALKGNKKVRTVRIGNNVQTIGYGAFSSCTELRTVTIGTGLRIMEGHLFCQDTKLKTITIKSTNLKRVESNHVFEKVKATVKVPSSKVSAYRKLLKGKNGSIKVTK